MDQILKASIFSSLDEQAVTRLLSLAEKKYFDRNDLFIKKGMVHNFFAILLEGEFDVFDEMSGQRYVVASLSKPGDFVGGQSLLGKPASMNVEVCRKTECLIFNLEDIRKIDNIYTDLIVASALDTAQKLESTNEVLIHQLKKASTASSTILMCLSGFSLAMIFLSFMASINYPTDGLWSWLFLLCVIPPPLVFITSTRQPFASFGVTLNNIGKSLQDGFIASAVVVISSLSALYLYHSPMSVTPFDLIKGMNLTSMQTYLYLFHCYLQEFFVRGTIQTSLEDVIQVKWRVPLAIVLASAIFSVLHYPFGFTPILVTFGSGLLFGYVYSRTRNLVGVTIFHYISGKLFFSFFNALQ